MGWVVLGSLRGLCGMRSLGHACDVRLHRCNSACLAPSLAFACLWAALDAAIGLRGPPARRAHNRRRLRGRERPLL